MGAIIIRAVNIPSKRLKNLVTALDFIKADNPFHDAKFNAQETKNNKVFL